MRYLNLIDHEDVGVVLCAIRFLGAAEGIELPDVVQSGEYEAVDLLIHELDETGVILRTEGRVAEISGRSPEEVIGQSVLDHLHPDGFDDALKMWMEVMTGPAGTTRTGRQRVRRPDGSTVWVEITTIKRVAEDGTVTCTAMCHDLTERRKQESALRTSQLEFRLLADQVPAAVFRADQHQRLTFRNERWTQLLGEDPGLDHLRDVVHRDDRSRLNDQIEPLVAHAVPASTSIEVRGRDGDRMLLITCQSVVDLVNDSRSLVGSVTDITDTVELRERAAHDPLTRLHNRSAIEEHLAAAIAEDPEGTAVVFLDLDDFKSVNDRYGHETGDRVLVALAERLQSSVRPGDIVGRYGGDEFVLVLRASDADDTAIALRLEQAMCEPVRWATGSWRPTVSIGIAHPEGRDDEPAAVLRDADRHMFTAKRQRKLRVVGGADEPAV
jgi:diguanylate cyclase (GGDEF)-like protein/PAS domain S-box-containing protein